MKSIFDDVSVQCSKLTTRSYSTSFSLGIYFLNNRLRNPIYSIYGFVRFADEIVDSFHEYDKQYLLMKFRDETYEAIRSKISMNPILNSFQQVVNEYNIEKELIDTFLESMEMDLNQKTYSKDKYEKYILGSAEVVGLMCLRVFTEGNNEKYNELLPFAKKLGAAFQKINFLRDIKADYQITGRTYFPGIDMSKFTNIEKEQIEKEIEEDFRLALYGIKKLPSSSKGGVYLAYVYYNSLLNKIKKLPADKILLKRISIGSGEKFRLMVNSMFQFKMNLL